MNIRSERSTFALLVGMTVGVLASIFMTPTFWGPILGVFAAATLAEAASPKDGAIIGAMTLIPIGIYITIQTAIQINALQRLGILVTIPLFCIADFFGRALRFGHREVIPDHKREKVDDLGCWKDGGRG
jgi:hypothetical protein